MDLPGLAEKRITQRNSHTDMTTLKNKLQYTVLTESSTGTNTDRGAVAPAKRGGMLATKVPSKNWENCKYVRLPKFVFEAFGGRFTIISPSHCGAVTCQK